jgi:hypothetical protein
MILHCLKNRDDRVRPVAKTINVFIQEFQINEGHKKSEGRNPKPERPKSETRKLKQIAAGD